MKKQTVWRLRRVVFCLKNNWILRKINDVFRWRNKRRNTREWVHEARRWDNKVRSSFISINNCNAAILILLCDFTFVLFLFYNIVAVFVKCVWVTSLTKRIWVSMVNRCYQIRAGAMYVLKHFVFIRKSSAIVVISYFISPYRC